MDKLEVQDQQIYTTMYKIDLKTKDLIYSTGNDMQRFVITYHGKESEKEYLYITEPFCCIPETNTTL